MNADDPLLQADQQARQEAIDISRSFIVQAPAGSGKTELLIQRYLRLLNSVNDPEEVLAITFTRKAAAEMKLRVLEALRREADGRRVDEPHLQITAAFARDALLRSQELGWDLLGSPRRMRILTLDALNASLARSRPLANETSTSGRSILADAELRRIHRDAARATLDWLSESVPAGDAAAEVLAHLDNHTGPYIEYLATMLSTRDQWLPFIGSGTFDANDEAKLRELFESSLRQAVERHLAQTRSAMEPFEQIAEVFDYAAANVIADNQLENPVAKLIGTASLPGVQVDDLSAWQAVADLLTVKTGGAFRKRVNKNIGFPAGKTLEKALIESMLEAMADNAEIPTLLDGIRILPPIQYTDEQWQVLVAMFRLLPLAVIELRRLFSERGAADHIEVALAAEGALGTSDEPGDLALLLDYRVSHILVDEMQDTSIAQYRMLESLTGGWEPDDGRTLFCVGDPMQSIYRFRNAEVGQFLLAREHGIGDIRLNPLVLRQNFRSGEVLVNWFNSVFPGVLANKNNAAQAAVAYEPAVPAEHLAGKGRVCVHPVIGNRKQAESEIGSEVIRDLRHRYPDDTVAILVQGRSQLPELLYDLRDAGVAYTAIEIDRLTDLPEIIDVLALTRAAAHPADRIAWLGVLRGPAIGLSFTDLHALAHSDQNSTVLELLGDPDRVSALSGEGREAVEAALPHLLQMLAPSPASSLSERVERCWMLLGGPATLSLQSEVDNVARFFELIRRNEVGGLLRDSAELESILDTERVSTSGDSNVQVMTMHRAKGLQFDHVVLYGLGRQPGGGGSEFLSWFDVPAQSGGAERVISPIGPRADVERDPIHRFISATRKSRNALEEGRLLYVACTRAQKSLHIVGNVAVSKEGDSLRPARKDSLLRFLWSTTRPDFENAFGSYVQEQDSQEVPDCLQPRRRVLQAPWSLPTVEFPGSVKQAEQAADAPPDDTPVDFYWVGTDARIAGTLVHRWLQLLTENRVKAESDHRRSVTERWLHETGIGAAAQAPILDRVEAAVSATMADEQGRWCVEGEGHAELALSGIDEGELVSVVLDRVRIDEGQHWIIDYKTSAHEGGNLDGFLDVEVARYRPQLARYARLYEAWSGERPRCALYFPLLARFVEVDAG